MNKKPRKSMANVVQFLDRLDIDCLRNQDSAIAQAKKILPFAGITWEDARWDITNSVQHKVRGHETRKTKYLNFYRNVPNNTLPLMRPFGDIVKALTVLRFVTGGQGAPNLQRFIDGWRYIYDALEIFQHRIELMTPQVLNSACRNASDRLSPGTAYNVHKSIHEIADLLDKNKLTKLLLGFRYAGAQRPENVSGVGYQRLDDPDVQNTSNSKLASDEVLAALGLLYQKIPKESLADRTRILLVTLAIFLGRRIGEILTMPALPVQRNENGTPFIYYYPQKWAHGDLTIVKGMLPVPTKTLDLIESVVNELLEITAATRDIAQYIAQNNHADFRILEPYLYKGWLSPADLRECLGISNTSGWVSTRGLVSKSRLGDRNRKTIFWDIEQVKEGMNRDVVLKPVIITNEGQLFLKDCLAILPLNACQSKKCTFKYAVRLIDWQQISDFLGCNRSRRAGKDQYQMKGKIKIPSAFDRYLDPTVAKHLSVNSHAFRHTLNTWLDEGGMSDTAQTRWFGRKNPRDTKAYQHTSPAKAALQVRKDLLDGAISGHVAQQIEMLPISMQEAVVKARVRAVHDVGPGLCFHDFSQMPCERSLQCTASCEDFHWRRDDVGRRDEVKRQYALTLIARKNAEVRAEQGRGKSKDWLAHNDKKLQVLSCQIKEMGLEVCDPDVYLAEFESK